MTVKTWIITIACIACTTLGVLLGAAVTSVKAQTTNPTNWEYKLVTGFNNGDPLRPGSNTPLHESNIASDYAKMAPDLAAGWQIDSMQTAPTSSDCSSVANLQGQSVTINTTQTKTSCIQYVARIYVLHRPLPQ